MLAERKIDSLDTHLEQFKLNNETAQNDLQNLLKEYGQLLDDYKDLKKKFETKSATPVAKTSPVVKLPAAKQRNPYVLVLVDGDGYIFNDEFIRDKEEGGMRAARMLNEAVEKYLYQSVLEARDARIVVRVYADLTNLSKQLARSRLAGLEKRSLASFSAAFTRAISLFDFVDALDEEGTKIKIREQFKVASEDDACSHILYAACHDTSYLSQLVPLSGVREKVTLVQGAGWSPEFHQFNLNVTQFPTVFRWLDLPAAVPNAKGPQSNGTAPAQPKATQKQGPQPSKKHTADSWRHDSTGRGGSFFEGDRASSTTNGFDTNSVESSSNKASGSQKSAKLPCRFFQKGFCRFGEQCNYQHAAGVPSQPKKKDPTPTNIADRSRISELLPSSTAPGLIPLNKHSQRLDPFMRLPSQKEWAIYNERFHKQKPCNNFHLKRRCSTFACPYDHHELEPESRYVLEYVLKSSSCPDKSECRAGDCFLGHICQKDGCQGKGKGCKMKADLHAVDPVMVSLVPAEGEEELVHGMEEMDFGIDEGVEMPDDSNGYFW
ncbi:hypothetical protein DE146DRAFT_615014 [Phaeosphaeria sp. MPI-PUGE-AT-0046c]|nr:hypothetical protein DE146DRAFT_615014 [Phaeosphaeria sp. MPI-PUGE-AT-0046c]